LKRNKSRIDITVDMKMGVSTSRMSNDVD